LEAMLNAGGTAYADGELVSKRFAVWFWGNGVKQQYWIPATAGVGWTPPESLKPFADDGVLDYVSVATNLSVPFDQKWAHHSSYKALWTGAEAIYDKQAMPFPYAYGGPRVDDVIEKAFRGK